MLIAMLESQFRYDNAVARVPAATWPLQMQELLTPARAGYGVLLVSVGVPVSLPLLMSYWSGGVINQDDPAGLMKQTSKAKTDNCPFAL